VLRRGRTETNGNCVYNESSSSSSSSSGIPRGCQFSPDGTCLLTARANRLELYNTPYEDDHKDNSDNDNHDDDDNNNNKDWKPAITCNSGESVRSYAWYPHMKSSDPASCCFLGVSRDSPVHLYDAYDGSIRATYRPYNALDEMESPSVLCFAENGQKLVTGGLRTDRILHVFDINRPGREHSRPLIKLGKTRRSKDGQKGLVSAMAYSEASGVIAVGTYSPGSIYLYDLRTYSKSAVAEIVVSSSLSTSSGGTVCVAGHGKKGKRNKRKRFAPPDGCDDGGGDDDVSKATTTGVENALESMSSINFSAAKLQWYQSRTRGGVTQVEFGDDTNNNNGGGGGGGGGGTGHYLFSTSRRSNAILQWDLRKLSSSNFCPGIDSFETDNYTNQRIEFQLYKNQIWTGGRDGCVRVYDYSHRRSTSMSTLMSTSTGDHGSLLARIGGFRDCVNGISLHPDADLNVNVNVTDSVDFDVTDDTDSLGRDNSVQFGNSLLAVAVGSRHFPSENDWENEDPHVSLTDRTHNFVGSTQVYSLRGRR